MADRRTHGRRSSECDPTRDAGRRSGASTPLTSAVVIVQARVGSTRLPGKVMKRIGGKPMILHVLERAARIGPEVTLATSTEPIDDGLAALVAGAGYRVSRGSQDDVLQRFARAVPPAARFVVRVTADCPLFDPNVGRAILDCLIASEADLACNTLVPTFPDGLDCWAVTRDALLRADREATRGSDREHVLPYIWRQPGVFRLLNLSHSPDLSAERWTVDDERDLAFVRAVHERTAAMGDTQRYSMYSVLEVLSREPHLRELNPGTVRDEGYARSLAQDREGQGPH